MVRDREAWHATVHGVGKSQTWLGYERQDKSLMDFYFLTNWWLSMPEQCVLSNLFFAHWIETPPCCELISHIIESLFMSQGLPSLPLTHIPSGSKTDLSTLTPKPTRRRLASCLPPLSCLFSGIDRSLRNTRGTLHHEKNQRSFL